MGLFFWLNKNDHAKQKLEISDDSGFIGIVNSELYNGFVDEDWELEDVLQRFTEQTNHGACAIWSTGEPNFMNVYILDEPSSKKVFRELQLNIKVTNEKLWLVNYTDLTMVAQFERSKIPSTENADLEIPMQNGNYNISIRQMFDPKKYNAKSPPNPCFEIVFSPVNKFEMNTLSQVLWWQDDKQ